jgi:hypothetical protein
MRSYRAIFFNVVAIAGLVGLSGIAVALDGVLSDHPRQIDKIGYIGDGRGDAREGGETMADAIPIETLPFSDTGATCDNRNDAGLSCAGGAASADVFYVLSPTRDMVIDASLCGSAYDTALGIYEDGIEIACSDDFCGLQSDIDNLFVHGGRTYHIQVDGFGSSACGSYVLNVTERPPCVLECPAGALQEGEPPCHDLYVDEYNGGCNTTGFPTICPQGGGSSAVLCGKSGTFVDENNDTVRDTDWYTCWGTGGVMTMSCVAEFPLQLLFIYGTDCSAPLCELVTAEPCQTATISRTVPAGMFVWAWVGVPDFTVIPCESDYTLTLGGIAAGPDCAPSPTQPASWGRIKSTYRRY